MNTLSHMLWELAHRPGLRDLLRSKPAGTSASTGVRCASGTHDA